ncbi:exodeoxyribonuclease III [Psittacicella gerlachiana]|uniref:Exodeoxyribonuclease III n=1 Tax=Psittacicella gerlachiana TaxID=2028574 RepID=A0A3A1YBX7_9GAMM|nr:exodeoxyribonuclease III [Psittacicella gerlachiana]RIY35061.1 exodeoxyribonuclease III [Psittacicella gerlachiana]
MKIVSFNINSVRAHMEQLLAVHSQLQPDIIGLQEIKVHSNDYPEEVLAQDYHIFHFGQKTHYGVAIYSKYEPENVYYGFPHDDEQAQRRLITIDINHPQFGKVRVINGYFPQGDNIGNEIKFPAKRKFYADLMEYIKQTPTGYKLIIMGDYNISPQDIDIGIGAVNARRWLRTGKCSFQPEEREWMDQLYSLGLVDTFRIVNPDLDDKFSWFDYRSKGIEENRGLRIDLIMCSQDLSAHVASSDIDLNIRRMEKPSDHAPVYTVFK